MTKAKNTKRALVASVLSMMLCLSMLVGSTFAWFTDSVTSGVNKIVAGNLDVELEYATFSVDEETNETVITWNTVEGATLFDEKALWEPGYTQVVYLKVRNAGTLALKYKLSVNVVNETPGATEAGEEIRLSKHLVFGQKESEKLITYATREDAWAAVGDTKGLNNYTKNSKLAAKAEEYVALVVYMPTTVGNEANYRGDAIPTIELGVDLFATQDTVESDSFDEKYDKDAILPGEIGTAEELKKALNDSEEKDVVLGTDVLGSFAINSEKTIDLNGNKIGASGRANTIIVKTNADLTVKGGTIEGMTGSSKAVDIAEGATVTFEDVTFSGNVGSTCVGVRAKAGEKTKVVFKNCTFENNQVEFGGRDGASEVEILFYNCTFTGEYAGKLSCLINASSNYLSGEIVIDSCTFNYKAANANGWKQNAISVGNFAANENVQKAVIIKNCIFNLDELAGIVSKPSSAQITVTEESNIINRV